MSRTADHVFERARVWTGGAVLPDADAVAVSEGRVVAVGTRADLASWRGPRTRVIDAAGATLTPGLADAHLHLLAWARARVELDLHAAGTRAAAVAAVRAFADAHRDHPVVMGRGWEAAGWEAPPEARALDAALPDRPVVLHARDFHTAWVNGRALAEAGITRDTPDPEGGRIERDATGAPTGVLREHAVRLMTALEAAAPRPDPVASVRAAAETLLARGITQVHDFEAAEAHRALRTVATGDGPRLRVLMHLPHAGFEHALELGLASGTGDTRFRIGALKLFADGTLGSRTAAMLAPYEGTVDTGMDVIPRPALHAIVARALAAGLSVAIHAIGDRAVRASLDAFEAAGRWEGRVALAPRIEHVQLAAREDLARFTALGVAASVQPSFVPSDAALARRHWGARAERGYAWRDLLAAGALVAFGSDAPVETPGGALMLHAAVTRTDPAGTAAPLAPAQALTLDQALACATEAPAKLAGWWPELGRIAPGALADLVLWNHDLHALPPPRLHEAAAQLTMLGGEVLHEAPVRAPAGAMA